MLLSLGFVLFYVQLSLVMAYGNYVHYATFMSARAYLAAGSNREDQKARAKEVIVRMLKKSESQEGADRWPLIARGVNGGNPKGFEVGEGSQFKEGDRVYSWMQGVRYTFRSRLFLIPLGREVNRPGSSPDDSATSLTLTSESWLGREPAWDDCQAEVGKMGGYFDNGC